MASYSFKCNECENIFDLQLSLEEKEMGSPKKICPQCSSKEIKQIIVACNTTKSSGKSNINQSPPCGNSGFG